MTERFFKILNEEGQSYYANARWNIEGEWMPPVEEPLVMCENGYHLCRTKDLIVWLECGYAIYEAEGRGDRLDGDNKVVFRESRLVKRLNWDERLARLFACDCAEHVLHIFEERYPNDKRPRVALDVARRYANGEATQQELEEAAAAWAAWAAWAARAVAWGATGEVAWEAEREWQTKKLLEYLDGDKE